MHNVEMTKRYAVTTFFGLVFSLSITAFGQTKPQNTFVSPVDKSLTVRTIVILPVEDNVSGIYARPVEQHLREVLSQDTQWTPSELTQFQGFKLQTLYTEPNEVIKIAKAANADALLKLRMTKGPAGINGRMTLFSGIDGLPLVEENLDKFTRFEINDVKVAFENTFQALRSRLPYRGEVLSRRGQEITINTGKNFGIKPGSDISIIQILKVHRHPKFNFIVSSQREILGKARVYKVDDTLSFARIVLERDPGVVQVGSKILSDDYIRYSEPYITEDGQVLSDLDKRPDKDVAYGEKPQEWLPEHPAQYGKASVLGGLSQYAQSTSFSNIGTVSGSSNTAPTVVLNGEFWISPDWYAGLQWRNSLLSVKNDYPGAKDDKIDITLSSFHVMFGRNILLSPDFFGPKLQVGGGFAEFLSTAEPTTPVVFSDMKFSGLVLHFSGQFPVGDVNPTDVGFKLNYYWRPTVSDSPSSGNTGDVRINDFAFFFNYHTKPKFSYVGELRFENYSSKFSEGGSRNSDIVDAVNHKVVSMVFGVEFLF